MRRPRRRRRPPQVVHIAEDAANEAARCAAAAFPFETGGVLLGWRTDDAIHVFRVVEVSDPAASPTRYERDHDAAQIALDAKLESLPVGSEVGYVGEWHSHGAPLRHSRQDRRELRAISQLSEHPVALVIIRRSHHRWAPHALTAHASTVAHAKVIEEPL